MKSGDTLGGRYRLEQKIGEGGMGAVWSAYDQHMNRLVAIKAIIHQEKEALTRDMQQRLLREARACRKLQHPNIVQIFDVGETPQGEPFIVLELLQGRTLGELLKDKRRLEPQLAARIAAEIASGLAAAQAARIVHRDLKPANIFLHREEGMDEDTFVSKILDFGVCKNIDSPDAPDAHESIATKTGIVVGSVAYMSPEQVGMRKDLDHRSDIWSLGIVLYEMLTGARPFTGSIHDVIRQVLLIRVPAPSDKVREVPHELDAVVTRCTSPKREERYSSAEEVSQTLFAIARMPPRMTRKPTFTGVGAAPSNPSGASSEPPAIAARPVAIMDRPAPAAPQSVTPASMGVPPSFTPPAAPSFAPIAPPPPVDDDSNIATLQMQPRMMLGMMQQPQPVRPAVNPPSGTQIIEPNAVAASPAPTWDRGEMDRALAAHRQSYGRIDPAMPIPSADGHTQMIDTEQQRISRPDPTGTTSAAGALWNRTGSYPTPPVPLMAMTGPQSTPSGRHKKNKNLLFWVMGIGVTAAIGVMALLVVFIAAKPDPAAVDVTATTASASTVAAAGAVVEAPKPVAPMPEMPSATPSVTATPTASVTAAPATPVTAAPTTSVVPPPVAPKAGGPAMAPQPHPSTQPTATAAPTSRYNPPMTFDAPAAPAPTASAKKPGAAAPASTCVKGLFGKCNPKGI